MYYAAAVFRFCSYIQLKCSKQIREILYLEYLLL